MSQGPKRARPTVRAQVVDLNVTSIEAANRATSQLADVLAQQGVVERRALIVDLLVGDNTVNHGLGGRAVGVNVCPTAASVSFAWHFRVENDKQVTITVLNVDQPRAVIEVFR